jgi:acetolactate synthase-1/3 small subunit
MPPEVSNIKGRQRMGKYMKKRWVSLFVENDIGVLAKISGLFSGKSYNLESLTVGTTEDKSISRMTIGLVSDDITFEQIKKQLNRLVEVIKVLDFTNTPTHMKEILFIKVKNCTKEEKTELFQIAGVFKASITDYGLDSVLLECVQTETKNDDLIRLLTGQFKQLEIVRGGSVAIESISMTDR